MTHVLVPLDGSPLAEASLPFVEGLVRLAGGHVTLLYVAPANGAAPAIANGPRVDEMTRRDARLAEAYLHDHRRRLGEMGIDAAIAVTTGRAAPEILRYAEETGADLIALSTHGRSGPQAWAHGSVAEEVLHTTRTPLLLVRPGDVWSAAPHGVERLIIPLDGSPEAEAALAFAERFAVRGGLPLALVRCVEPMSLAFAADPSGIPYPGMESILARLEDDAREYLAGLAARLRARGLTVSTDVSVGSAARVIADHARATPGAVVVLASHAGSGWQRLLLGSVARRVVHTVPTPVIVCPARARAAEPARALRRSA